MLLAEEVGELDASRQGVGFVDADPKGVATGSLDLRCDDAWRGPGMQVAGTIQGGPAGSPGGALRPDAVIPVVDGVEITPAIDIGRLLNLTAGREVPLSIRPASGGEPVLEPVRPAGLQDESRLACRRWVDQRRAPAARLSGGRLDHPTSG